MTVQRLVGLGRWLPLAASELDRSGGVNRGRLYAFRFVRYRFCACGLQWRAQACSKMLAPTACPVAVAREAVSQFALLRCVGSVYADCCLLSFFLQRARG